MKVYIVMGNEEIQSVHKSSIGAFFYIWVNNFNSKFTHVFVLHTSLKG